MNDQLDLGGIWKQRYDPAGNLTYAGISTDFDWKSVTLPAAAGPGKGAVWLRRHFRVPSAWQGRYLYLVCDGAEDAPAVWLNGHPVGRTRSGRYPFEFAINGSVLPDRENTITLRLSGAGGSSGTVWGGLRILARNAVSVRGLRTAACPDGRGGALVTVTADIRNGDRRPHALDLTCIIGPETGGEGEAVRVHRSAAVIERSAEVPLTAAVPEPRLWQTHDRGAAERYMVTLVVAEHGRIVDEYEAGFGIRYLGRENSGRWMLNGNPLFIRGTVVETAAVPFADDAWCRSYVESVKSAGYNALRTGNDLRGTELYRACDRAGVLVWQELPDSGGNDMRVLETCAADTVNMLRLLSGHPSLAGWFCGPGMAYGANFIRNTAVASDPGRPVGTEAGWWGGRDGFRLTGTAAGTDTGRRELEQNRLGKYGTCCGCFTTALLPGNVPSMAPVLITPVCPARRFPSASGAERMFFESVRVVNDRLCEYCDATYRVVLTGPTGAVCAESVGKVDIPPDSVVDVCMPGPQWFVGNVREPGAYRLSCALLAADGTPLARNGIVLTVDGQPVANGRR